MNKHAPVADAEPHDGPSLFVGIALEVDEIVICRNRMNTSCAALRESMIARHESGVKQAADEIANIAAQAHSLSAHLASVIARHLARKPRA